MFISAVEELQTNATPQNLPEGCTVDIVEIMDVVIGISLKNSSTRISHSQFEGNKVDLGAVIYDTLGSDIKIFNKSFINNSATGYCTDYCCFAGGIVYVNKSQGSNLKVHHSKFENNVGAAIFMYDSHGDKCTSTASIIHSKFINNTVIGPQKFLMESL